MIVCGHVLEHIPHVPLSLKGFIGLTENFSYKKKASFRRPILGRVKDL